jgi:hypothetical protein
MMDSDSEHFWASLRDRLIGRPVSFRRLAGDSLLIYVDCEPGDQEGLTIWFDPIWHFRGPQGVLVGSMQAAETSESEGELDVVSACMDVLHQKPVEQIVIEPLTRDLRVTFAGGYCVETFVSDPTDGESWHIRDNATGVRLKGCPTGLSIVTARPRGGERPSRDDRDTRKA